MIIVCFKQITIMVALVKKTSVPASCYTFYNGLSTAILSGNNFNSNGKYSWETELFRKLQTEDAPYERQSSQSLDAYILFYKF